ncbi:MAG: helix-turn-helix transcriptional regulator [Streptomycetaceae bacterium]|nr:helix-turn-helix transcriptional regulator [Streptomycetaceae bacterium]
MREGVGLSVRALAARAGLKDYSHLARFERGERELSAEKMTSVLQVIADRINGVGDDAEDGAA